MFRSLVGLDAAAVEQAFTAFVHKHPRLSSQQLRFLHLLQNHIAQNGGIELERLYEPPFTTIHAESIDGLFPEPGDVDELLAILSVFDSKRPRRPTGPHEPSIMSTLTTQQKSDIDKLWTEFWTGGITNPLTVIEQISFLMFARLLDIVETTGERKAERTQASRSRVGSTGRTSHAAGRTSSRRAPTRCCASCATRSSRTSAS